MARASYLVFKLTFCGLVRNSSSPKRLSCSLWRWFDSIRIDLCQNRRARVAPTSPPTSAAPLRFDMMIWAIMGCLSVWAINSTDLSINRSIDRLWAKCVNLAMYLMDLWACDLTYWIEAIYIHIYYIYIYVCMRSDICVIYWQLKIYLNINKHSSKWFTVYDIYNYIYMYIYSATVCRYAALVISSLCLIYVQYIVN